MSVRLIQVGVEEAEFIWEMQVESFLSLYEKYQDTDMNIRKRISPLFILPNFRGRGYATQAIIEAEKINGDKNWFLDTILQEEGNCALYEKMGYVATGKTELLNDRMTLVDYEK